MRTIAALAVLVLLTGCAGSPWAADANAAADAAYAAALQDGATPAEAEQAAQDVHQAATDAGIQATAEGVAAVGKVLPFPFNLLVGAAAISIPTVLGGLNDRRRAKA